MNKTEEYHAFISHSQEQSEIAGKICATLENDKFKVYNYETANEWGKDVHTNIYTAINKSHKVVLLVSKKFMESEYFVSIAL